jgi:hypothetical protein
MKMGKSQARARATDTKHEYATITDLRPATRGRIILPASCGVVYVVGGNAKPSGRRCAMFGSVPTPTLGAAPQRTRFKTSPRMSKDCNQR